MENNFRQRSRVRIALRYADCRTAKSIAEAVSPDNIDAPKDLRVETTARDTRVFMVIEGEKPMETMVSTVEDLMSCVQATEKALRALQCPIKAEKEKRIN